MSADAPRLVPAWVRYGAIAGIIAFACTLAANLPVRWLSPADLCRRGPFIIPLLSLGALVIFVAMAAAAGFKVGRLGGPGMDATLAGLLVGVLGGCALIVLLPFVPSVEHRFQELNALCPGPAFGGASFSFTFGSPPPGFVIPTPPPEVFATPPPGALAFSTGAAGTVGRLVGMVITILCGIGVAVGAATVAGRAGMATRPDAETSQTR